MLEPIGVDGIDLIDIEIQFRCLPWDAVGDLFQLGMAASDHSAGARALRGAIVVSQTALGVVT